MINTGVKRSIRAITLYVAMGMGVFYTDMANSTEIDADRIAWEKNVFNQPHILEIQSQMRERFKVFENHLRSGDLALSLNGWIVVKNNKVDHSIKKLIAQENKDRKLLFEKLAGINGNLGNKNAIQLAFAEEWLQRARKESWWVRIAPNEYKKLT